MSDIKTLEMLAEKMLEDTKHGRGLNAGAVASIADIILRAIGAPLAWPSRVAGVDFADSYYSGSPQSRMAFNHGVKWAIEHYAPTVPVKHRFPTPQEPTNDH